MQLFFAAIIAILFFMASLHILCFSLVQLHLLYFSRKKDPFSTAGQLKLDKYPRVTIQLPLYNEKYVAEKLIDCICALDYPSDRLDIQVLDDSTDETSVIVAAAIAKYKHSHQIVHVRRTNRTGFKAGALKAAMPTARGEFIAIFDADFRPAADFLLRTIPTFQHPEVGVMQTRWGHLNEEYSLLTKLQAVLLNNHFIVEQNGRYRGGMLLQFNGTAGIWRKQTIVDAGGWNDDTLVEDLDLSYRAQFAGWKIVFRNDIVCPAELPADLNALKVQQFRWMQGGAEAAVKHLRGVWAANLTSLQKLHATMHLIGSYVFISIFLTGILSVPMIFALDILQISPRVLDVFALGMLFNGIVFFAANYFTGWVHLSKPRRILRFLFLFPLLITYCMGLGFHNVVAVAKGFLGIRTPFNRTPKYDPNHQNAGKMPTYHITQISTLTVVEWSLILYFGVGIGIALYTQNFAFLSLHIWLLIAYTLVSVQSLPLHFFTKNKKFLFR